MITNDYFDQMKPYKDFKHWFRFYTKTGDLGVYAVNGDGFDSDTDIITSIEPGAFSKCEFTDDWNAFKKRPEFALYETVGEFPDSESMINYYERLLIASNMIIAEESGKNPDTVVDSIMKCLEWLRTTDFYTCPASTQYHDSFHGGLLLHTLKVVDRCKELMKVSTFGTIVNYAKAIRVCLVHDWCKIGLYESYMRNVKDIATDSWKSETSYRAKRNRSVCLGHGAASMFVASKFFKLSYEEALAIRWHMGEYNVSDSEMVEFNQACRQYPMVYLIQFADRISCVEY